MLRINKSKPRRMLRLPSRRGSSFLLNGAFCTNKTIVAIGKVDMMEQAMSYPRHLYPLTKITDVNTVHFCKTQEEAIAILRTMF